MEMIKIKNFGRDRVSLPLPYLLGLQKESWKSFWEKDLKELLFEVSPIRDYTGKELELWFLDYKLDEPKYKTDSEAKENNDSYEAPLRVKTKLVNLKTKEIKEQEVFLTDFPLMTERGTFIVNGVERVAISQLIRSPGAFFTTQIIGGRNYFGAKIIPNRGAWLEFETEPSGFIGVKIDRRRKVAATTLLRAFGIDKDQAIKELFQDLDRGEIKHIEETLRRDLIHNQAEALVEIYQRLRPGDMASSDTARELIENMFFNFERYDLSRVGRWRMNQRLSGLKSKTSALAKASTGKQTLSSKTEGKAITIQDRVLKLEDVVAVIREIIRLNNDPEGKPDQIDHLGNRRVRTLNELLLNRLRVGLMRMERIIKDRMSTLDIYTLTPIQIINPRPFMAVVKEFFTSSQISQFMDNENPLAELEHKRRLSATGPGGLARERAGFEVRDVQPSHYGRICPIQTPEGPNIGLVGHLASFAKINPYGFLETPYLKVEKGRVTSDVHYLNAYEEEKYNIASGAVSVNEKRKIISKRVEARILGEPGVADRDKVDFIDVSSEQPISIGTSLIPFLQNDDANRALMGSNMQRQSVPLITPEAPLVMTGVEERVARDSGQEVIAEDDGIVIAVDATHIKVKTQSSKVKSQERIYNLKTFVKTNQYTCFHQKPLVKKGKSVKKGDVLTDGGAISQGHLALGQNILVAFLPWRGGNFEDAIIISERLVKNDAYASIYIDSFSCDIRETKLGPEVITCDIPNVSEEKLKDLDEEGIVRVGAEVGPNDILVGKISPKGETDLTVEERLLKAIFGEKAREVKDTSLLMEHGKRGRVVGVKVFSRELGHKLEPGVIKKIEVEVAEIRKIQTGDKLSGRHGNKGVVSKVLPVEEMPFMEDGTPVDVILNPLSVVSRMNLGQILETHLGWAAKNLGYHAISPALAGAVEKDIKEELKTAGLSEDGKVELFDGRTGFPFPKKITVGYIYMMKLIHMVEDKIHMRSIGPYSLITQQPLGGKAQFGGQRFGEMEVWALEGYGAAHTLQEMLTIKSDDVSGRAATYEAILKGEEIKNPNTPASFNLLVNELKSLGLSIELKTTINPPPKINMRVADLESIKIKLASPEEILSWSHGEIIKPETINYRTQRAEKDGLFCEKIFGPERDYQCYCGKYRGVKYKGIICDRCGVEVTKSSVRRERMGHIKLATSVSHIWFLRGVPSRMGTILDIPMQQLERVIYFATYVVTNVSELARKKVLEEIEKEYKQKTKNQKSKIKNQKRKLKTTLRELKIAKERAREEVLSLKPLKILSELEYHNLSLKYGEVFEAGTGAETLRKIFEEVNFKKEILNLKKELSEASPLNRKKILRRLKVFQELQKARIRPEWMFLTVLPVLPPDLRPMVQLDGGRYASSDLNDLYRRVINRNNRLKYLLEINAPEVIVRNEKRMLQEAVDALIDNGMRKGTTTLATTGGRRLLKSLADILKGKQGRFRQNLLGKRVDYSGRSVIVVGPQLKLNQCGLPKKMALELFKPFVIKRILDKELAYNVRGASKLIDEETDEVWENLEEVVKNKLVLLNRAPTLHRLGVQAFQPVLIEGESIQVHPLVCSAFNADFDGDQMAVHLPLSTEAQTEAREIMLSSSNLLKPATGLPVCGPTQDIVLGCYWLTEIGENLKGEGKIFGNSEEAIMAYELDSIDLKARIKIQAKSAFRETSVGRILFNEALPKDFPFQNEWMSSKKLEKLIANIINRYKAEEAKETLDKIKDLGFEHSTFSGITWGMDDLVVPEEKPKIIEAAEKEVEEIKGHFKKGLLSKAEERDKIIEIWTKAKSEIEKLVPKALPASSPVTSIVESGARGGSWSQAVQMTGMKGLVINPVGQIIELPVKSSYKEGFSGLEYFISTHGARKGTADTALRTSAAGYLTRRLVDVAHEVVITEEDCRDEEGIEIFREDAEEIGQNFLFKIVGRTTLENVRGICKKGEIIGWEKAEAIVKSGIKKIRIRSPLSCKSVRGICRKCYGWDLGRNTLIKSGEAVGIVAAQAIGEPGTQLTLKTFHTGGVAGGGDITFGLPRVQEVFEVRPPGGKAEISQTEGKVLEITPEGIIKIKSKIQNSPKQGKLAKVQTKSKIFEYKIPERAAIWVELAGSVKKGQPLCEGSLDLRELFKLTNEISTQRYIVKEIQKIYVSQGVAIHDKHIEVICRQMFSRLRIKDSGDSLFSAGEIIERAKFLEENNRLKKEKQKPAKGVPILLGMSRVALTADSFLSAASFQETSRVLIRAAIAGKEDKLYGLKENVIIGKLIPAGTGFQK